MNNKLVHASQILFGIVGWAFFIWGFNICWMAAVTYWSLGDFRVAEGLGPTLEWWKSERLFSSFLILYATGWAACSWLFRKSNFLPAIHIFSALLISWLALRYDHWTLSYF